MNHKIHIKNMVCPRCIDTVRRILHSFDINFTSIELGEVVIENPINDELKKRLSEKLESKGFELLENNKSAIISKIKSLLIDQIHYSTEPLNINFSSYLTDLLHHDYSYLSRLFSSVEGITIERFILKQKIEKVKELLFYNELTLSEIAFQMSYSSTAHLSSQFKKETGMTPSEFKKLKKPGHTSLDTI